MNKQTHKNLIKITQEELTFEPVFLKELLKSKKHL